jgi:hypothetical protein
VARHKRCRKWQWWDNDALHTTQNEMEKKKPDSPSQFWARLSPLIYFSALPLPLSLSLSLSRSRSRSRFRSLSRSVSVCMCVCDIVCVCVCLSVCATCLFSLFLYCDMYFRMCECVLCMGETVWPEMFCKNDQKHSKHHPIRMSPTLNNIQNFLITVEDLTKTIRNM